MPDQPAPATAKFIVFVIVFFGLLGLLAALMIGIAIKLVALVAFGVVAAGAVIWLVAKLRGGKAPGA